jgi:hypothetical protein
MEDLRAWVVQNKLKAICEPVYPHPSLLLRSPLVGRFSLQASHRCILLRLYPAGCPGLAA